MRGGSGETGRESDSDWPTETWIVQPAAIDRRRRSNTPEQTQVPEARRQHAPLPGESLEGISLRARQARLRTLIGRLDKSPSRRPRDPSEPSPDAFPAWLTDNAIHQLERRFPGESAVTIVTRGQSVAFTAVAAVITASAITFPLETLQVLAAIGTLFFALVVSLRVFACVNILALLPTALLRRKPRPDADGDLPVYTVLVPLFREANVLEPLVASLSALDYPAKRLDIKLILERVDTQTRQAARSLQLPPQFEIVVVPDSLPRTKPKALNYALQMARGDYVVVYDAEDRPEPGQLRKALSAFSAGPPNLACLQARLTIYNGAENWLTNGIR